MRILEMVRVDLKRATGETINTSFTRSNGDFEFTGLTSGMYLIVIEERGYEPVRENIEILNASRPGVAIFLRRPLILEDRPEGTIVSARELGIPRKARGAMEKGRERLHQKNDARGSIPYFEKAVAEYPTYYEAYYQLGNAHLRLDESAPAEAAFRKSVDLSQGNYADAHLALAALLANQQRFTDAEPYARRGLGLAPNGWYGRYELGRSLLGLNRIDEAEKNLLEARSMKPDYPQVHLVLANLHIRKQDARALLEDLDSYLRLEPNGPSSAEARQKRDLIAQMLAKAQSSAAQTTPKP